MDPGSPRPTSTPPPGARPLYDGYDGASPSPQSPPSTGGARRVVGFAVVAAVLAVAALLALGLRDSSTGGTPFSPIAAAAERTGEVSGARFAGTGTAISSGLEMTMSFGGVYDAAAERTQMRMQVQSAAAPQAALMNPLTAVQDGLTMYMSSPAFANGLPDGKSWMKLDLSEFVPETTEAPASASSMDADAVLEQLELVGDDARIVGRETVRGAKTIRYAATIDPALQAQQLQDAGNDLAADVVESQGGPVSVEVWIDRAGLVRRTAMTVPFELMGGPGASMSMTMDFFDFGIEPEIEIPADEAVFDATELGKEVLEATLEQSG